MNETLASLVNSGIWAVIKAVLLLPPAFVTAAVVKSLVVKLFTRTKLHALLGQAGGSTDGYPLYSLCAGRHLYGRRLHGTE